MSNTHEIVGFPQLRAEASQDGYSSRPTVRFELVAELRRQRQAEITRISGIAAKLTPRFGAETTVGFLCYEILGQRLDRADLLGYAERLERTPSILPIIVEELLDLATHSNERSRSR